MTTQSTPLGWRRRQPLSLRRQQHLLGGVQLDSFNGLNFNNSASFGPATTPIAFGPSVSIYVLANPDTTAPVTIPNAVTMRSDADTTLIYTGHDAVTFSGGWTLGSVAGRRNNILQISNDFFPSATMIITGGWLATVDPILRSRRLPTITASSS